MGGVKRSGRFRVLNKQMHRVPILPYRHAPNGQCRLCGCKVQGRRRKWCSDECILNWAIASNHRTRRTQVYLRDRGECKKCSKVTKDWQVDHIKPLIECSRGNISAFLMDNLRTLCVKCHSGETKTLNRKRRKERRELRKSIPDAIKNKSVKIKKAKVFRKKERRTTKEILRRMSTNPTASLYRKIDVKKMKRRF